MYSKVGDKVEYTGESETSSLQFLIGEKGIIVGDNISEGSMMDVTFENYEKFDINPKFGCFCNNLRKVPSTMLFKRSKKG